MTMAEMTIWKRKAEFRLERVRKIVDYAEGQHIPLHPQPWKKIRMESRRLVNLSDDRVAIENDVRELKSRSVASLPTDTPAKGRTSRLRMSISMVKKQKAAHTRYLKACRQAMETKLKYVGLELKASIKKQIRKIQKADAEESARFDAKIGDLELKVVAEEAKEREFARAKGTARVAQELMKEALSCCERAVSATEKVLKYRVSELKESRLGVKVVDTADVLTLRRICGWKFCLKGFRLRFVVGRSVGGGEESLCKEIGALSCGAIDVEVGEVYQLWIDEEGECHFSKVAHEDVKVKEEKPNV